MYQQILLVGNVGRDPELRYSSNGDAICNFSLATSRKYTTGDGEKREETTWLKITTWGKLAETVNQYLLKGGKVLVTGTLVADPQTGSPRVYQRKDGTYGASFEVRADTVRFLSAKNEPSDAGAEPSAVTANGNEVSGEDLPF